MHADGAMLSGAWGTRMSKRHMLFIGASILALGQFDLARAQSTNVADSDDDIIVTAQKIEQRAVDVPITISATSGKRMRELGVSDLDELSNYTPGLNIQEQSANNPGVVIRGITSDSGSPQQGARVTLYYNGVDISRSRGSYQDIYDVERIEVIKGPQATLFGTASAVGAISIVSAKPRPGLSGELSASYGNYDATVLAGHLNAGSEKLAGRIAFAWKKRDGYVTNLSDRQDDLYAQDQLGIRGSLRFTPTEDVTADLVLTYDRQRNSGTPFISGTFPTSAGPANPFGFANLSGAPSSRAILGSDKLGLHRDLYDANLTINWDINDAWTLTTVNGYRDFNSNEVFDGDGSAAWYLELAEKAVGWQASHELRFAYNSDTLRASFGWNLFRENGYQRVPIYAEEGTLLQCLARLIPGLPCVAANGSVPASTATGILTGGAATVIPYALSFETRGKNDSYSLFADATWIPVPSLELTAGVRGLIEKRRSAYLAVVPNSVITGGTLIPGFLDTNGQTFRAKGNSSVILPRVNALYRFSPGINGFATISKGQRSPTVDLSAIRRNGVVGPNINRIAAETVWNYEVGLKVDKGIFSGSLGVYYQVYDNFQVSIIGPDGRIVTDSAGSATNLGTEAEIELRPASWLSIFGNVGFIDGGIDDKASNGRYAGARFRLQPKVQSAVGFTADVPIGESARFFMTPSLTYRSRIYFEVPNSPLISQKAVTLVNLRAGVSFADDRFELVGFARNLTNKNYLLDAGNTGGSFGVPTFIPAEPRFYGMQLTGRF
jgi:outer membrane receptor protein involved in Fe transport